jgi:hypothetical protein
VDLSPFFLGFDLLSFFKVFPIATNKGRGRKVGWFEIRRLRVSLIYPSKLNKKEPDEIMQQAKPKMLPLGPTFLYALESVVTSDFFVIREDDLLVKNKVPGRRYFAQPGDQPKSFATAKHRSLRNGSC